MPGEMFVHRNVANVVATDPNCLSALKYAVDAGGGSYRGRHYGCGVRAAGTVVDNWLRHV
jgi:hypothetical protein